MVYRYFNPGHIWWSVGPLLDLVHIAYYLYSTAHIQVYKKTCVMSHALRNLEDNSHVGLM